MAEEGLIKPDDALARSEYSAIFSPVCWSFLPLAITLWFIGWVIDLLDSVLAVLPDSLHPNAYLAVPIPELGAVVTLFLILFLGVFTSGVATRRFLAAWEKAFVRIPVFRGVYTAVQKLVQTFLGPVERATAGRDDRIPSSRSLHGRFRHGARVVALGG